MTTPALIEACASVGIEHGLSTTEMLRQHMISYHNNQHNAG